MTWNSLLALAAVILAGIGMAAGFGWWSDQTPNAVGWLSAAVACLALAAFEPIVVRRSSS